MPCLYPGPGDMTAVSVALSFEYGKMACNLGASKASAASKRALACDEDPRIGFQIPGGSPLRDKTLKQPGTAGADHIWPAQGLFVNACRGSDQRGKGLSEKTTTDLEAHCSTKCSWSWRAPSQTHSQAQGLCTGADRGIDGHGIVPRGLEELRTDFK